MKIEEIEKAIMTCEEREKIIKDIYSILKTNGKEEVSLEMKLQKLKDEYNWRTKNNTTIYAKPWRGLITDSDCPSIYEMCLTYFTVDMIEHNSSLVIGLTTQFGYSITPRADFHRYFYVGDKEGLIGWYLEPCDLNEESDIQLLKLIPQTHKSHGEIGKLFEARFDSYLRHVHKYLLKNK